MYSEYVTFHCYIIVSLIEVNWHLEVLLIKSVTCLFQFDLNLQLSQMRHYHFSMALRNSFQNDGYFLALPGTPSKLMIWNSAMFFPANSRKRVFPPLIETLRLNAVETRCENQMSKYEYHGSMTYVTRITFHFLQSIDREVDTLSTDVDSQILFVYLSQRRSHYSIGLPNHFRINIVVSVFDLSNHLEERFGRKSSASVQVHNKTSSSLDVNDRCLVLW